MLASKLSDFEINKRVGIATGDATAIEPCFEVVVRNKTGKEFNPCKNPADAWPIILANKINIEFEGDVIDGEEEWWSIASWGRTAEEHQFFTDDNPLRAAMIVFLMIQESANVQTDSTR